ncbi:hypothetical protein LOZ58_005000 [Ophidiomyces ophidiicola]|nr:hypothetical protein LOZ58_005000 [Ophidiomyces ophidiicola]
MKQPYGLSRRETVGEEARYEQIIAKDCLYQADETLQLDLTLHGDAIFTPNTFAAVTGVATQKGSACALVTQGSLNLPVTTGVDSIPLLWGGTSITPEVPSPVLLHASWPDSDLEFGLHDEHSDRSLSHQSKVPTEPLLDRISSQSSIPPMSTFSSPLNDFRSIELISSLYDAQLWGPDTPIEISLLHARQGLALVSSCLPVDNWSSMYTEVPGSSSLALCCIHLTQQVLSCYASVKFQNRPFKSYCQTVRYGQSLMDEEQLTIEKMDISQELKHCREIVMTIRQWCNDLAKAEKEGSLLLLPFIQSLRDRVDFLGK